MKFERGPDDGRRLDLSVVPVEHVASIALARTGMIGATNLLEVAALVRARATEATECSGTRMEEAKEERAAVIGLGYVELPLVLRCARHFPEIMGFDIPDSRVSELELR